MVSRIVSLLLFVLLPVAGVLWWDWDWRSILVLYWCENLTVIAVTLTRMSRAPQLVAPGDPIPQMKVNGMPVQATKGRLTRMFAMVFGIFTLVHGFFIIMIIGRGFMRDLPELLAGFTLLFITWGVATVLQLGSVMLTPKTQLGSVVSEYSAPMKRIFVLHITVILTVFAIIRFDMAVASAFLLIGLHFVLDVHEWWRERKAQRKAPTSTPQGKMGAS